MEVNHIYDPQLNEGWIIGKSPDFEFVNPIEHFKKNLIQANETILKLIMPDKDQKWIEKFARKKWFEWNKEVLSTRIPKNLIGLLTATTKKEQVALLKGLRIDHAQLTAFIFKAWTDYRFKYSFYSSETLPNDVQESDLPMFFSAVKDQEVKTVGKTVLSKGKLRQVIEHRHYIAAKFLDAGNTWHCFFYTFKSLGGGEKSGIKHCHYVSSTFGKSREEVLQQIKSDRYALSSLPHIEIVGPIGN